ncbi:MAG: DNA-binding transcriptional LysR family regulator [Paracoccaceae bacterium]|jgi:DNA-binding transcriptional LysR family regulator
MKQLRYVEATGRLGSIANAAVEINISQSSITAAIGALESQVGFASIWAHASQRH